jgi:hypothetical protein
MIDFDKELQKYEPKLDINNIEDTIKEDDIRDIFDIIKYFIKQDDRQGE